MDAVVADCVPNPASHSGCLDVKLMNELKRDAQKLHENYNDYAHKAACLWAFNIPGTTLSGAVPTTITDLAVGGASDFVLPDPCE